MGDAVYIWGFPGLGKSSVKSELNIVDADCKRFEFDFNGDSPADLHGSYIRGTVRRSRDYPRNYFEYINALNADAVLINCHISMLEAIPKEKLILVYPAPELKDEYLKRYAARGDSESFINHMNESFEDMVSAIEAGPFRKIKISEHNIYLKNLLEKGGLMAQFVSKKELTALFDEGLKFGIYIPPEEHIGKTPDELAQMLFEGEIDVDVARLRNSVAEKKEEIAREELASERRGGLTREELADKLMQGIVNGTLSIYHGEIAPYHYGYEVTAGKGRSGYINRWECYCDFSEVADCLVTKIEKQQQDVAAFSNKMLAPVDVYALTQAIDTYEERKLVSFVEEKASGLKRRGRYTGDVATLEHVHRGVALDGIIQGHFNGDYSSITTSSQNNMLRTLVAMKGFCLDCINMLESRNQRLVVDYLKKHGMDISTPEKLDNWIRENPDKCGLPENRRHIRKPSLDSKIVKAEKEKTDEFHKESPEHETQRE